MQQVTLLELNTLVQRAVAQTLPAAYWLTAELASATVRGHFYGELVQKDEAGRTVASARCTCWQSNFYAVSQKFYQATGGQLRAGMQVLLQVRATFHPQFGFSYNITDIDPTYTLGDAARRRQEILRELERQGIMRCNRDNNPLPLLLQRIAVISSATAAGYGDFCHQLLSNQYGLRFLPTLFPSVMQGNGVEESVMNALTAIAARQEDFDAVVIIRGGGAVTDLDCFDNYRLAEAVALFPLPVFTGIGHERDEVVLDFVAHTRLKTPTAVAAFLTEHNARQFDTLNELASLFVQHARLTMQREQSAVENVHRRIVQSAQLRMEQGRNRLESLSCSLPQGCLRVIDRHRATLQQLTLRYGNAHRIAHQRQLTRLELLVQKLHMLDPRRILQRGYSMTTHNGALVTSASQLQPGDTLQTTLADGTVTSTVN